MKIIITPSKTQTLKKSSFLQDRELLYPKKHKKILAALRKLNKTDLSKAYNVKGDLLESTYKSIKNYSKNDTYHAFVSFDGLVFKNLETESYKAEEYIYLEKHLRILDAFYGVLEPGTLIKPYRLDMKTKIGFNLYHHWDINSYFKNDIIVNLASDEFSKLLDVPLITISFLQNKNGVFINQPTYSKQARGVFLDFKK